MAPSFVRRLWRPPPAPPAFGEGIVMPDTKANLLSLITFSWLTPLLSVGWSRPLDANDLWDMDERRSARRVADALEAHFYERCPPFKRPQQFRPPEYRSAPPVTAASSDEHVEKVASKSGKTEKPKKKYDMSLLWSINHVFFYRIWLSGLLRVVSDTLNTCTPLVSKLLIAYITTAYYAHRNPEAVAAGVLPAPRSPGYGIGLAFGIFAMQETASLCNNMFFYLSMTLGFLVRTSLVSAIFRKALRMSGKAKQHHSTGQITTMISADCTRLDIASGFFHLGWSAPIQIVIGVALLINNLGVSALVGLGVLLLSFPLQGLLVSRMINARKKTLAMTDRRVRLLQEVLQGIRLLLLFHWQGHYMERIIGMRRDELRNVRRFATLRGMLTAFTAFVPILAATLTYITYALTGHALDPATIFASLQLFNIIRAPLFFFPLVAAACSDGYVSLQRIAKMLMADELEDVYSILGAGADKSPNADTKAEDDSDSDDAEKPPLPAVSVHGSFTWEAGGKLNPTAGGKKKPTAEEAAEDEKLSKAERREKADKAKAKAQEEKEKTKREQEEWKKTLKQWARGVPTADVEPDKGPAPFELRDVDLTVRKGAFVAIVGRVASGKSSLLQALTGDMRRTSGDVVFGGSVAYAPQAPWIQNLSLRDNILFGHDYDEQRFREVLAACALERDIAILPDGVQTEIGERGVTLSGGQKARINLARVAYHAADVALIDDPLSAVDSHVAKHILEHCLLSGPLAQKTRILVTHQLYVLPYVDEVIFMDDGRIAEKGTYTELVARGGDFAKLIEEYGAMEAQGSEDAAKKDEDAEAEKDEKKKESADKPTKLVTGDERETGAVSSAAYISYARAAGGVRWTLVLIVWLAMAQVAQVASTLFLGFWTESSIPGFASGDYMGLYAGMGVATAVFTFVAAFAFAQAGFNASLNLFRDALKAVMRAPLGWHEMTPTGAIMNRLSKDIDTLDSMLPQAWFQLLNNGATIVGTIGLVFYSYTWLGIMFPPLIFVYWMFLAFYRRTSIEAKRLDSILRTVLYAGFSEALNGMGTIRAYRAETRFIRESEKRLDSENRSYFLTIVVQRWLGVRMDILSNLLVLAIGLIAVGLRNSTNPAKIGIVLTYTLSVTQVMGQTITMLAQVEQNMNTVERIVAYVELEPEPAESLPTDPPAEEWPTSGAIKFDKVCLRYRPHLPLALDNVSFEVKPGERVGIVGRTGAGKSTILGTLFRTGPLESGRILVDGVDIGTLGLARLREALSIIPQDAVLFEGTLRTNIDPKHQRTDAELHDALRRVGLVNDKDDKEHAGPGKFDLDREVRDDSFSAGEKQLLALCRALVRTESKILVLDEATSSVDVATDATIQMMIQQDFRHKTLLCIAHRLNTIVYYDRILVMDQGHIAEYDTPLNLFDAGGIFRSLCDQASLTREDIVRIRASAFVKEE